MSQSKVSTLEGNELADDYVRTNIPKGRWADTWDIFKSNFSKLVLINVLTLLFFVPGIAIVYFRASYVTQLGLVYPFSGNVGIYPYTPSTDGLPEQIILSADILFYSLLIVAGFIASVGLAGAAYSIKKIINTRGEFTFKGYFHGVKVCYFNVVLPVTLFLVFLYASFVVSDWSALVIAQGGSSGGPVTAKVFIIIATVLIGMYCSWLFAVGVSYRVKLRYLFKNSFVLLLGTIVQSVFMLAFSLIPVWLMLIVMSSSFLLFICAAIMIVFGISLILLCWLAYTQWVFDMYITPVVKTEQEAKRAQMSPKQLAAQKEEEEKAVARELLAAGKSELIGRPLRPIEGASTVGEIGVVYGRSDIKRAADERLVIQGEINEYYEEHRNDIRYVEYEKLFAEREKALQAPEGKKGKKKRVSSDNLLNNK